MKNKIKKPITRRFFIYIIVLIILSNILLFLSISVIVRNIMEKQVTESSINLLQRNLENVNEYLAGIDNVANSLIYNQDLIELVKRKENTLADVNLMSSIFSIFYQSRNDLKHVSYTHLIYPHKVRKHRKSIGKSCSFLMQDKGICDRIILSVDNRQKCGQTEMGG